jgi:hypothetical protein
MVPPFGSTNEEHDVAALNTPAAKLHISLPADLYEFVVRRQRERGESLSAAIAESIRNDMVAERQARLDAALALDAEDNLAFARLTADATTRILGR